MPAPCFAFLWFVFIFFTLDLKTCFIDKEPWHEICEAICPKRWIFLTEQKSESSFL